MKIVIELPEAVYNACKQYDANKCAVWSESVIANGIPYEERPNGKWIFRSGGYYKCSNCGEVERAEKNYCSNCGARMER